MASGTFSGQHPRQSVPLFLAGSSGKRSAQRVGGMQRSAFGLRRSGRLLGPAQRMRPSLPLSRRHRGTRSRALRDGAAGNAGPRPFPPGTDADPLRLAGTSCRNRRELPLILFQNPPRLHFPGVVPKYRRKREVMRLWSRIPEISAISASLYGLPSRRRHAAATRRRWSQLLNEYPVSRRKR